MERKWWTLVLVSIATFILLLDVTVVNVALPDIQREPERESFQLAVGGRRLLADARRLPPDGGIARRPARATARLQAAIAVVPVEKSGMGSGINTTFRQAGIATGVAGLGAVFQGRVDARLGELLPNAPHGLGEAVASGGSRAVAELPLPPAVHEKAVHAADVAFVSGFNDILMIGAIICFAGAALGFWLVRSEDFVQPTDGPSEPAGS